MVEVVTIGTENVKVESSTIGIDLLRNTDKVEIKPIATDIETLEMELNDLTSKPIKINIDPIEIKPLDSIKLNTDDFPRTEVKFDASANKPETKSWDGFKPFSGVPDNVPPTPSKEDTLRDRFVYLRKLESLELKGVRLSRKYTIDSPLDEMKGEYENLLNEKARTNNVKFQGNMLMGFITGLEYLNSKYDPFDIKLDGWSEQLNENITDYDEIFAELHDKYSTSASMSPELKLLFQLGGGAMMLHMTNTMFKSSIPGMDDVMNQNPEMMRNFTQAAAGSMNQTHPGFSNCMNTASQKVPTSDVRDARDKSPRRDMKGPSEINSDLLNGIKPRIINVDQGSTVTLAELNEMKDGLSTAKKGRKKSDKSESRNTMKIDFTN